MTEILRISELSVNDINRILAVVSERLDNVKPKSARIGGEMNYVDISESGVISVYANGVLLHQIGGA